MWTTTMTSPYPAMSAEAAYRQEQVTRAFRTQRRTRATRRQSTSRTGSTIWAKMTGWRSPQIGSSAVGPSCAT